MLRRILLGVALLGTLAGCGRPPDPLTLLRANRDAMYALQAYRADCSTELTYDARPGRPVYEFASLTAEKPTRMRYDEWHGLPKPQPAAGPLPTRRADITFASHMGIEYEQFGDHYRTKPVTSPKQLYTILEPWEGFYAPESSIVSMFEEERKQREVAETKYAGVEAVAGVKCDRVTYHKASTFAGTLQDRRGTYFIGQSDHLVRRLVEHITFDGKRGYTRDATIRNIDIHPKIDTSAYVYTPPAGVQRESSTARRPKLLTLGKPAPDFACVDQSGKRMRLSSLKGNIVLVDFWASWCAPCVGSMSYMQQLTKGFHDVRVSVVELSVDDGEPKPNFDDWVASNREKYPDLRFAYADSKLGVSSKLYRVSAIPTQYVIDQKGIIRAAYEGFDGSNRLYDAMCAVIYVPPGMKIPNVK